MRTRKARYVVVFLILALAVGACGGNSALSTYHKSLQTTQELFTLALEVTGGLYKAGQINEDQKAVAIDAANKFKASWLLAAKAEQSYLQAAEQDKQGKLNAMQFAFGQLAEAQKYLINIIQAFGGTIPKAYGGNG